MKKSALARLLGVPENSMEYGHRHIKIFDQYGKLILIASKGAEKLEGPRLKAARKTLLIHGLTEQPQGKRGDPISLHMKT